MKKFCKSLLFLSVLVFVINCQAKVANSDYEVVDENINLTPDFSIPEDDPESNPGSLSPLTDAEFSIVNASDFNTDITANDDRTLTKPIEFNISDGNKINRTIFLNTDKTSVVASAKIIERSQGANAAIIEQGIRILRTTGGEYNTYSITINAEKLKEAFSKVDTYAKIQVDIYVQDLRGEPGTSVAEEQKQYAVTKRSFTFTIKRV